MIPKDDLIVMKADASADEALKRIFRENKSRIFVYEDRDIQLRRLEDGLEVKEKERQKQYFSKDSMGSACGFLTGFEVKLKYF